MTPSARRDESATDPAGMTGGQVDAVSVLTDALKAAGAKDVAPPQHGPSPHAPPALRGRWRHAQFGVR